MSRPEISGQLSPAERELLTRAITDPPGTKVVERVVEVGTWLGGGSTLHILRALHERGTGHLWGIEFSKDIYDQMLANLRAAIPEALHRFTPLFGSSEQVIPAWLKTLPPGAAVDFAFLDGGDNPDEQIHEFQMLDPHMPVGSQLMAHDARVRKGKWLVPYLSCLDHWKVKVHDLSEVGLLHGVKIAEFPSSESQSAAKAELRRRRNELMEVIARLLPRSVRPTLARLLPKRLMQAFLKGAKEI